MARDGEDETVELESGAEAIVKQVGDTGVSIGSRTCCLPVKAAPTVPAAAPAPAPISAPIPPPAMAPMAAPPPDPPPIHSQLRFLWPLLARTELVDWMG